MNEQASDAAPRAAEPPVPPAPEDADTGFFSEVFEFAKAVGWAVGIAIFLRSFALEAYKIPSGSMIPTLEIGDHIFVNKSIYGFQIPLTTKKVLMWRNPHRGEVIVFKNPRDVDQDYIKRVIGEPGDRIDMRGEDLYVNDRKQEADVLKEVEVYNDGCYPSRVRLYEEHLDTGVSHARIEVLGGGGSHYGDGPWIVPEGNLFVMGDNRDNSADSRAGYYVPMSFVKGKAMFVWLSWDSCGSWWPFQKIHFNRMGEKVR